MAQNKIIQKTHVDWKPSIGLHLPSIRALLLHDQDYHRIYLNTMEPTSFSTDLFEGKMHLLVNSKLEKDPYFIDLFQRDKYSFQIQIQGKFKKQPNGMLYIGAEITKKMDLGYITYGICNTLLKIAYTAHPNMHHSFGDSRHNELPHITGPFWSFVDRLVITGPHETPPLLKEIFPEDIDIRNNIGKNKGSKNITSSYYKSSDDHYNNSNSLGDEVDLDCIYSFSHRTTKFDIVNWQIVNIPFLKPINLTTFWGNADLRLVLYSIPYSNVIPVSATVSTTSSRGSGNKHESSKLLQNVSTVHSQDYIDYVFAVEIQHIYNHPDIIHDHMKIYQDIKTINSFDYSRDNLNRSYIGTTLISIIFASYFFLILMFHH